MKRSLVAPIAALALLVGVAAGVASGGPALSLNWYGGGACDDALAQNPGDPAGCRYDARETKCADGVDNDSDELTDAFDPDCICANEADLRAGELGACSGMLAPTSCADGLDNDRDGAVDCNDADCANQESCLCAFSVWNPLTWACGLGAGNSGAAGGGAGAGGPSNAGNGSEVPPSDPVPNNPSDLLPKEICEPRSATPATATNQGGMGPAGQASGMMEVNEDEDGDGLVNCDDPDCHTCDPTQFCFKQDDPSCGEVCNDGIDNDNNGYVDCDDPNCESTEMCTCPNNFCDSGEACSADCLSEVYCYDMVDNDEDGRTDCADSDCVSSPDCQQSEKCDDGFDNDRDGATDCADSDCWFSEECIPDEDCKDGYDNDGDGATDCADSDCYFDPVCVPESNCSDGLDNDQDGEIDCADVADCGFSSECSSEGQEGNCYTLEQSIAALKIALEQVDAELAQIEASGYVGEGGTANVTSDLSDRAQSLVADHNGYVAQLDELERRYEVSCRGWYE
jgi:hypothetical protein